MELTDEQWDAIVGCFPAAELRRPGRKGGRPWQSARAVLDGVLWVMRTGAPWADLPPRYPSPSTCHRRFQAWVKAGVMVAVITMLRRDLEKRGGVEDIEGFIDGTYVPAKRGVLASVNAGRARRPRSWLLPTAMVFHSLSVLETETDTTPFSPTELSMLLSYRTCHRDWSPTKPGTCRRSRSVSPRSAASS
jgi:transposase